MCECVGVFICMTTTMITTIAGRMTNDFLVYVFVCMSVSTCVGVCACLKECVGVCGRVLLY